MSRELGKTVVCILAWQIGCERIGDYPFTLMNGKESYRRRR